MWRAFFLALGIYAGLLGLEGLVIDKAVLADVNNPFVARRSSVAGQVISNREIVPAPWVPWSLLTGGGVVMLYALTMPRRSRD